MTQSVKCLSGQQENLSEIDRSDIKIPGMGVCACHSNMGGKGNRGVMIIADKLA